MGRVISNRSTATDGYTQECSGKPHDFSCGYLFPCFSISAGVWGHKDVCASEGPCIAHLPGTSNTSSQTCGSYCTRRTVTGSLSCPLGGCNLQICSATARTDCQWLQDLLLCAC